MKKIGWLILIVLLLYVGQHYQWVYSAYHRTGGVYDGWLDMYWCTTESVCLHEQGHHVDYTACGNGRIFDSQKCSSRPEFRNAVESCTPDNQLLWLWIDAYRKDGFVGDEFYSQLYADLYFVLQSTPGLDYASVQEWVISECS